MIFTLDEIPHTRSFSREQKTLTVDWLANGQSSEVVVANYAVAGTPPIAFTAIGLLYRQDIQVDEVGFLQHRVRIPYGIQKKETGQSSFGFNTTGSTVTIRASKEHVETYGESGALSTNPHKGLINVNADHSVEGTDIVIPALTLMYTFRHPLGQVNEAFAVKLARATGRVSSSEFRGFAAGELLFLGASGSDGTDAEAEVTYNFAASENATITMGDIVGIVKKGHHYAWVESKPDVLSDQAVTVPKYVHVERVYDEIDFETVFGWS